MSLNRTRRVVPTFVLAGALLAVMLTGAAGAASPPVGDWRMNEGSGTTLVDSSASGNNGTIAGNPTWVTGQHGQAIRFDGTGDYATVPDSASLDISGAITMAAWVKPERAATQNLIKKANTVSGTNGYELSLSSAAAGTKVFVRFNQATSADTLRINSTTLYPINGTTWMHVAATYDGTTIRLYVNGVQESQLAATFAIATNNLALGIAAQPDGASQLQGAMDDVLVYNSALTASEVAALAVIPPSNTPPTLNPIGNKNAVVGSQLAFTATASDPDAGDTLTFSLANGTSGSVPAGASITSGGSFTWTPTAGQVGTATFDVCVSDGTASDCETINVAVTSGDPLVGDWKANEGSGTTLVNSSALGATNNGTILGNPTWVTGQHGQAIRFDGTGDYATVGDNASLDIAGAITMATWVKPEKVATQYLMKKAIQGGTDGYELSLATTGFAFVRFNSTASGTTYRVDSPTAYPTNGTTWVHLAATSDGTTIRLYVNGAQVATKPAPPAITTNNVALGIGGQSDGVSTLQGAMDDVLLYNTALSASQIAALATTNTPPTLNPVGNKNATAGSELAFTATASDPDAGDTLTFSLANGTSGSVPAGASITAGGAFSWTPSGAQVGAHTFDVCVSDGSASDCETITVTVAAANTAPTLNPVGNKNATAGSELAFTATASDPDAGDTLTFSLANGTSGSVPAGASITAGGAFSWTPSGAQVGAHTFDVCVSDGSASDCETITVTVAAANTAPTLNPVGNKNATAGSELAFTATASDPDAGDTLTFSLANGTSGSVPAGASITAGGAFSWTPSGAQVGAHTFDVCVSDGSASDCETITVTVAAANTAPTLNPVGNKNATAGSELAFTATASDPDAGDTLTFSLANGTSGSVPAGASITAGGAFSWTPSGAQVGAHTFDVCVSDGSASDCETITVTVAAANTAPTLNPVGNKNATAGSELAFTATASDPDAGDTLTFSLANGTSGSVPAGASITAGGAFSWTPSGAQVGAHTFDVCVSDGSASDCETITVTVAAANTAPTLNPVGNKNATAGSELAFTATASDPDAGDTLTFSLANGTSGSVPAGASITAGGAFSWTPSGAQVGAHTFDVCVSDGSASDCETITVTVAAANTAPTLNPVGNKNATAGSELAFTATASDPDAGDTLTFSLANGTSGSVPAGASITAGGAFSWTPSGAQVGAHTFDVCVSDGSASDCETITVTVAAANTAPTLNPVGNKNATAGSELAFTATASDPDAGDTLTFSLANGTSGSVPAGASITAGGAFSWTPSGAQVGAHTFDVCVSDGSASDCETITVTVAAAGSPQPPVADFDGNGTTDISVFRPSEGGWYVAGQPPFPLVWGTLGDLSVPGDYDGNGTTDIAVFRNGEWYVQGQPPYPQIWGQAGDVPVPGDYDGNGTTDIAVFRSGQWYVQGQPPFPQIWGQAGDVPVPGDYDGNGTTDIAVFRNGEWYVQGQPPYPQIWGQAGDVPVPGDYDGNGTTDIAVFRNGEWYVQGQPPYPQIWGQAGDVPVPGDYDGNGTTDIAVFRNGEWYVQGQPPYPQIWGTNCDIPQPLPYAIRTLIPHGGCSDG